MELDVRLSFLFQGEGPSITGYIYKLLYLYDKAQNIYQILSFVYLRAIDQALK